MDFLLTDTKKLYFKFLFPSMMSALVTSVYFFVDAIAVGQSEGALGTAAMAVTSPTYGVIAFLAVLCGVGGSVMMSMAKGNGEEEKGNACFTTAVVLMSILTAALWVVFSLFSEEIFTFFGANAEVMPKTVEYGKWIIWFLPVFVFTPFMGAFIRNDGAPGLVMTAVVIGGSLNVFGDWFLVFPMKMGMTGAAVASVIGTSVQCVIMASHFFRKTCKLKLVKPRHYFRGFRKILQIGIGASALDLGAVTIGMMINNQIARHGGTTELAVFGVMSTLMSLFFALFAGVGQAVQPIVSTNYGAGESERIKIIWRLSLATVFIMGVLFTVIGELFPIPVIKFFMNATPEVLAAAPRIFRLFFPMFLFLGVTVLADYYLQSVMEVKISMVRGLSHSILVSGLMIISLPAMLGMDGVWLAMPVAESAVGLIGAGYIISRANRKLSNAKA